MPGRKVPLVKDHYYHAYNRGVASQPIFFSKYHYERFWETMFYYQNTNPPVSYSFFKGLPKPKRASLLEQFRQKHDFEVEIVCACCMPNHFHFLLKQVTAHGIANFLSKLTNSYTRYFNVSQNRNGPILQGKFKSVLVETNSQLLHVSRYIHLNPYSSSIAKTLKELEKYPYSSYPEYLSQSKSAYFQKTIILDQYKQSEDYHQFVSDQADYQRRLDQIKHLTLDGPGSKIGYIPKV